MKYIDRIRLPQLTITLSLIIAQSVLADGITSYYPLITEPSWVETSMDNSFFDGNKTFSESTNLLGIDSENRIIMPLINGFRGANPISVISHSDGGDFGDPFDTYGKTDETLSDTSLTVWKTLARSIDGGDGEGVAGVIFESTATYTTLGPLGPGSPPSDGVTIYRRVAKIGEVVVTRYRNDINSTSSLNDINYRSETTSIAVNRSAYVGTAMVPNLYPGSNPLLVTDAYSALVRVSENTITSITENFSNQGGTESSAGVIESGPTTVTTIEWTVKGIGVVRLLIGRIQF